MFSNKVIIEKQETGKTTYLLNQIDKMVASGKNIIILDSATEHEDKSLLKKVVKKYNNNIVISVEDESLVDINKYNLENYISQINQHFPFKEIVENKEKMICFDLSYFLEIGHEIYDKTNNINLYKYYRTLYNNLSQQIALVSILIEKYGIIKNMIVVTDEIEFPIVNYDMSLLQKNISFLSSVHPENSFGTFYNSFDKIKFKVYKRKA